MDRNPQQAVRAIVKRACHNYPSVVSDITKDLRNQSVELSQSYWKFLKLTLKTVGIITFPLWILPFAGAMYLTMRVLGDSQHYLEHKHN